MRGINEEDSLSAENRRSYSFISGEQVTISGIGRPGAAKNVISWAFYLFPLFGGGKKMMTLFVASEVNSLLSWLRLPRNCFQKKGNICCRHIKSSFFEDRIWKQLEGGGERVDRASNRNSFCSLKNNFSVYHPL